MLVWLVEFDFDFYVLKFIFIYYMEYLGLIVIGNGFT